MKLHTVPNARLAVPKAAGREIVRRDLIARIQKHGKNLYVCAGAGYGKTTLLSQIARGSEHAVWMSLAGESDVFSLVNLFAR